VRLRGWWTLVLGLSAVAVLAASWGALEFAVRRQQDVERERWREGQREDLRLRLSLFGQEALSAVQTLAAEATETPGLDPARWVSARAGAVGLDELLLLDDAGAVVASAMEPEAEGLLHPEAEFLGHTVAGNPVLWRVWSAQARPWVVGGVVPVRADGRRLRLAGGRRLDHEALTDLVDRAGGRSLAWRTGSTPTDALPVPAGWQLPEALHLELDPGPPPAEPALAALRRPFGIASLGVLLGVWLVSPWLARSLARPIAQLAAASDAVARGERDIRVPARGPRELVELGSSFTRMTESLREAEARMRAAERRGAWREIAQRIAHEIKNALTPLSLAVDNVETASDPARPRPDAVRRSLATAREQLESLDRLVGEFRSFARAPRLSLGPLDAAALCAGARDAVRGIHPSARVELEPGESLPDLRGDAEQLRRALINLVRNAVEASPSTPVVVRWGLGPGPDQWFLQVRDRGPGLSPGQRDRLGEPYFTTKPEGTGLGVAVVLQIVQAHGGEVLWEDRPDGGLSVRVVLPRRPREPE